MNANLNRCPLYFPVFIVLTFISMLFCQPVKAEDLATEPDFSVAAKAAIAIDVKTGKIFFQQNADEPLPIASMTKLLTLYIVLDQIKAGKLQWDEVVPISDHLIELSQDMNLSNVVFTPSGSYTVKDLFIATEVVSANAAAIALAEKIAGSEKDFVDMMRAKVAAWGIEDGYLISTSGINNEDAKGQIYPGSQEHEENLLSAKSMAIVARHLILDHPDFLNFAKEGKTLFAEGTPEQLELESWNWMLPGFAYEKEGVDGLKTGTTELAGACFTGTIERNGWRIITVIMNAEKDAEDNGARFIETGRLMDYVYDNWRYEPLIKKGSSLPNFPPVTAPEGTKQKIGLKSNTTLKVWRKANAGEEEPNYQGRLRKELNAPVRKNQPVGDIKVTLPNDSLGYLPGEAPTLKIKVVTREATDRASWWELIKRKVANWGK